MRQKMELTASSKENFALEHENSSQSQNRASECDINIPGIRKLFNDSWGKSAKIICLTTVLICAGFCIYFTVAGLLKYFKYPTVLITQVQSKQQIQFPPVSICLLDTDCYCNIFCGEERNREFGECDEASCNNWNASLKELNISLSEYWKKCYFISVDVIIVSTGKKNRSIGNNFVTSMTNSVYGSCATITHTEKINFLSLTTSLRIIMKSKYTPDLIFIPHGLPADKINIYELLNHNVEVFSSGLRTQLKIHEEVFIYKNITGRECYDFDSERERVYDDSLSLIDRRVCKLPNLPENFSECHTVRDVIQSYEQTVDTFTSMIESDNWAPRRICNKTAYAITVDFVAPHSAEFVETGTENISVTELIIKFPDGTRVTISEHFSYTLPDLISDLFAYWGFFLGLSAPIFIEIFAFTLITLYRFCYHCN